MSAGSFSCSDLVNIQLKGEQIWADAAARKNYEADVEIVKAIKANQTAQLVELEDKAKDKTVKVSWISDCTDTLDGCGAECTVGGAELEVKCTTYSLDLCEKAGFTVDEKDFRTNIYSKEEVIARGILKKKKLLDEYLASQAVLKLDSFKGVNSYTGGKGTVAGFETSIAPAYWNASLFSYLTLVAKKNKFANPYLISGVNLYEAYWNSQMAAANADGKGAANMFGSMPLYFDVVNIDAELDPEKATFLLDKGSVALFSKAYWGNVPTDFGDNVGMKYSVASDNLPGVEYDVTYKVTCSGDDIKHNFSLQVKAGIFRNPVGCDLNNTGVLKLVCE